MSIAIAESTKDLDMMAKFSAESVLSNSKTSATLRQIGTMKAVFPRRDAREKSFTFDLKKYETVLSIAENIDNVLPANPVDFKSLQAYVLQSVQEDTRKAELELL